MTHMLTLSLLCLLLFSAVFCDEFELKKVILITRHGDRTPTKTFPNTFQWEDLGELTGEGMNQLYKLGLKMRQEYIIEKGLISERYNRSELYVRSTNKDRTLQSAQSFLLGFYPAGTGPETASNSETWYGDLYPGYHNDFNGKEDALPQKIQSIPIHTVEKKYDLILHQYKNCPKLTDMRKELLKTQEWKQKEEETKDLVKTISGLVGKEVKLKNIGSAYHALKADIVHRKFAHEISEDLKKELIEAKDWTMRRKFYNREMGRLGAGMLLSHIANEMKGESIYKPDPKFIYYSAHDGTLLALMAALGMKDFAVPHYASYMVFEKYENKKGDTHIAVRYLADPVYQNCSPKCGYNTFYELILDGMTEYEYFDNQCDYSASVGRHAPLSKEVLFGALAAQVILIVSVLCLSQKRKVKEN